MQDFFDPETMLLSDELLQRYEAALKKLPKRSLYIWLLYRKGLSTRKIASELMRSDKKTNSRKLHDAYRKKIERILSETQKTLKARCIGKKCSKAKKKNNEGSSRTDASVILSEAKHCPERSEGTQCFSEEKRPFVRLRRTQGDKVGFFVVRKADSSE